jgi:hypothetical protein
MRAGLVTVVLLAATAAAADPAPPVRLVVQRGRGAEACPDAATLAASINRRLGWDAFDDAASERVELRVGAGGPGLRATIRFVDVRGGARGERVLESSQTDCVELAAAVELAIAITIDPDGDGATVASRKPVRRIYEEPPPRQVVAAPRPAAAPEPSAVVETPVTTTPSPPLRLTVGLGASGAAGFTPAGAGGAVGELALERGALGLGLRVIVQTDTSERVEGGGTVHASLLGAALVGCFRAGLLGLCGLVEADRVSGRGEDVPAATSGAGVRVGAGALASWDVPVVSPWFLRGVAELQAPIVGTRLLLGERVAWESPVAAGRLGLLVGLRF